MKGARGGEIWRTGEGEGTRQPVWIEVAWRSGGRMLSTMVTSGTINGAPQRRAQVSVFVAGRYCDERRLENWKGSAAREASMRGDSMRGCRFCFSMRKCFTSITTAVSVKQFRGRPLTRPPLGVSSRSREMEVLFRRPDLRWSFACKGALLESSSLTLSIVRRRLNCRKFAKTKEGGSRRQDRGCIEASACR